MLEVVSWFVMSIITHILDCYIFSKIIKEKFEFNSKLLIFAIIFSIINEFFKLHSDISKIIVTNLLSFLLLKIIYNKSISKTLIGTLITYISYVISEVIFVLVFIIAINIPEKIIFDNYIGIIFSNIIIFIIYLMIFRLKKVYKFIVKIVNWYDEKNFLNLLSLILLIISMCYVYLYQVSYNIFDNVENLIVLIFFLIASIIFIGGYFNEKSSNNKLTVEYTQLLDYVKTYEEEVVDKSKRQHEYKNQLVIINDMIPKTNKKAKEYLKKILNNVESITDNDWMTKLKNLPSGGIKGLIHFKIKKMLEHNVSIYIEIDKKLSKKDIWVNVDKNLEDVSTVLGVYLDNAIEAAIQAKDKQIIIEFINNNDNIEFVLSNSYSGNINFNDLDKEGYSTKGNGRGVGLSLVKEIIKNNEILKQSREINGKFYVQKLYIKK